jgi:micrococcal nuclease
MKLWLGWLVVMAAACGDGTRSSSPTATANQNTNTSTNAVVVRVIDGDTIDVRFGTNQQRVRLIGIDTPETKKPNTPIQCFGPQASDFTKHLLTEGTPVFIRRDVEARDDYGRLLGYVYRSSDGLFVNLELARQGYARPLTIAPNNAWATDFVQAAHDAEAANRGLWAACSG